MENKKLIPLGIEDYKEVKERCYYVDKTALIKQIVNEPVGTAILFTRPRRFGKSLALSMLRYFFEKTANDNANLFLDTYIYSEKDIFASYFGAFPLISLNFKNALGSNKEELLFKSAECIKEEYRRLKFLLDSDKLDENDKKYFQTILSSEVDELIFSSALANLTRFLHLHFDKQVIVLIDEYDTPIRYAYENGFYNEVINFYKSLFGAALKSNPHLYYAILTGILQVSKESIFSGLNNLSVNTVLDEMMDEGFGFTEKEVDDLLIHYELTDKKEQFKDWYDGYLFGKTKIYNPLSVLSAIKKGGKTEPYWLNTSEKNALFGLLSKDSFDPTLLTNILINKQVECEVDLAISYLDLDSPLYLPSYLLATGYLTIVKEISYDTYLLRIPNKEIEIVFEKEIVNRYLPKDRFELPGELKEAFLGGDSKRIKSLFENRILTNLSYYDFGSEKAYQIMVLCALSIILKDYMVRTEMNAGNGRCDIIAIPLKENGIGLIIEIKANKDRLSASRLLASSLSALKQIENKDYSSFFRSSNAKEIILYGISFATKSVEVMSKKVNLK